MTCRNSGFPRVRRLLARDAANRDVRTTIKERFTAALQLNESIRQRITSYPGLPNYIQRQGEYLDHGADRLSP